MLARSRYRSAVTATLFSLVLARVARADDSASSDDSASNAAKPEPTLSAAEQKKLLAPPGPTVNLLGSIAFGDGLRFNNPYRLHTQLGSTAKSLSLTAPYADFAGSVVYGPRNGLQHGASLHVGVATSGPQQTYLSLSYLAAYRAGRSFMVYGRVGPNLLLSPDVNLGGEAAASFSYFVTGAIGLTSELDFDLFYGAATLDKTSTVYPILSGQLGVIVDYEVLP